MADESMVNQVTRIARRRALPGREQEYEALVREMFTRMQAFHGFLGAETIPPEAPGGLYQVVVNFSSEAELAAWDDSAERREIFARMRHCAEGDMPEHRRLNAMEEWFVGPSVPAATRPARWRSAVVTWMGIWPLASLFIYFLTPVWERIGLPFLLMTAVNVAFIVACMTYVLAPVLTRLMHRFLLPPRRAPRQ